MVHATKIELTVAASVGGQVALTNLTAHQTLPFTRISPVEWSVEVEIMLPSKIIVFSYVINMSFVSRKAAPILPHSTHYCLL